MFFFDGRILSSKIAKKSEIGKTHFVAASVAV